MKIRSMTAGDADAVAALAGELGYPSTAEQMARRFERLHGREGEHALVADADGRVVGWTHVRMIASLEADLHAEVWGLVVSASSRSQGVGGALLAECERWAGEQGLASIRLRTNIVRTRAHRLYERVGYRQIKQQKVYEKNLELRTEN